MKTLFGEDLPQKTTSGVSRVASPKATELSSLLPKVRQHAPHADILGTANEGYECLDARCRGTAHDIVAEDDGHWRIECAFCGTAQWVRAKRWKKLNPQGEFRFRGGRFDGLTIDEAAADPRGGDYLAWAAEKHPRQFVREAVKKWLTEQGSAR